MSTERETHVPGSGVNVDVEAAVMAPRQLNRYRGTFRAAGPDRRWVGRCHGCGAAAKLEGTPVYDSGNSTAVIGDDGLVYTTRVLNSHEIVLLAHTCGRWAYLRPVVDGGKPDSKRHTCGARCTNATGPSCDCRCRGANHGAGH